MRTRRYAAGLAVLVVVVSWGFVLPASASHPIFSSAVERFEIDGNVFGSADGALDFVDEFDNGTIAPDWAALLGTNVEAGGVVTLKSPGTDYNIFGQSFDVSNIENETGIENGAGDFTDSSYWVPAVPATNTEFHFEVYAIGATIEAAGLTFTNLSAAAAAAQPGSIAGPAVSQQLSLLQGSSFNTVQFNTMAVPAPSSMTGAIIFRLSFDDASDMLTCSFSVNGGTTFQTFSPPLHIFNQGLTDTDLLLGAGAVTISVPPPPPPPDGGFKPVALQVFEAKNPSTPDKRKVTYKVKQFGIVSGNPRVAGASLAVKLDGTTQCFHMPASGWKLVRDGYKYSDELGVNGAVKVAELKSSRSGVFRHKVVIKGKLGVVSIVPNGPSGEADTNFRVANNDDQYCGATTGGTITKNDAKTFKVINAGAPASCQVAACSPSGAFLDESSSLF